MIDHPSYLELDRGALGSDVATRTHLLACERCRRHVERLAHCETPPAWVRQLSSRRPARRVWWGVGFAVAAAVIALVVFSRESSPAFTTVKGGPAVVLHIKRGDAVFAWDGAGVVMPGDHLRLQIAASEYVRVTVRGADNAALYDGPIPAGGALELPVAWEVDAQPGPEILAVVLTDANGDQWRTTLVLNKETR